MYNKPYILKVLDDLDQNIKYLLRQLLLLRKRLNQLKDGNVHQDIPCIVPRFVISPRSLAPARLASTSASFSSRAKNIQASAMLVLVTSHGTTCSSEPCQFWCGKLNACFKIEGPLSFRGTLRGTLRGSWSRNRVGSSLRYLLSSLRWGDVSHWFLLYFECFSLGPEIERRSVFFRLSSYPVNLVNFCSLRIMRPTD